MAATASTPPLAGPPALSRIDAVVHLSFAALMTVSTARFALRHEPAQNVGVLVLAAAVGLLYGFLAVLGRRHRAGAGWTAALAAGWSALVVAAPSFAWGSLPLFFLFRATLTGRAAHLATGATTAAVAVGLFRLSGGTDLAMLLGPLAAGALLALVHERMERDAALQRRLHEDVSRAQRQLAAQERATGAALERERVSREIHDTVTQGLASGVLLLEAALVSWPGAGSREDVGRAAALLRHSLADARSLVHQLSLPGPGTAPLPEALLQVVSLHLPDPRLRVTGPPRPVPPETRHALLRVAQSAAANIALHAAAEHVTVTVGFLPDAVTLDVHDDGGGFDPGRLSPPSAAGGYGLRAMRQRVERLGGVFTVESCPGEGTVVAAQLPAPAQRDGAPRWAAP